MEGVEVWEKKAVEGVEVWGGGSSGGGEDDGEEIGLFDAWVVHCWKKPDILGRFLSAISLGV